MVVRTSVEWHNDFILMKVHSAGSGASCSVVVLQLFKGVANMAAVRACVLRSSPPAALIRPCLVGGPECVLAAAVAAVSAARQQRLTTRGGVSTEVLYNLAPHTKVSSALATFGVREDDTDVLAVTIDDVAAGDDENVQNVQGVKNASNLQTKDGDVNSQTLQTKDGKDGMKNSKAVPKTSSNPLETSGLTPETSSGSPNTTNLTPKISSDALKTTDLTATRAASASQTNVHTTMNSPQPPPPPGHVSPPSAPPPLPSPTSASPPLPPHAAALLRAVQGTRRPLHDLHDLRDGEAVTRLYGLTAAEVRLTGGLSDACLSRVACRDLL